jgi:hypothetical protein
MRREDRGPVALLMLTSAFLGACLYYSVPADNASSTEQISVEVIR